MSDVNDLDVTVYFVGVDKNDAKANMFDSYQSAESYANDNPGTRIFGATIKHVGVNGGYVDNRDLGVGPVEFEQGLSDLQDILSELGLL